MIFGTKQVELSITVEEPEIFLYPSLQTGDLDGPPQAPDVLVRGQLVLHTKKAIKLCGLQVQWRTAGHIVAGPGHPYRTFERVNWEQQVDLTSEVQPVGEHRWEFSFSVPPNTTPYERSLYGAVRHSIDATAIVSGRVKDDLVKASLPMSMFANVYGAGEAIRPLEANARSPPDYLGGGTSIRFTAGHASVASPVWVEIKMPLPPPELEILSIEAFVSQTAVVTYEDGTVVETPSRHYRMFSLKKDGTFQPSIGRSDEEAVDAPGHPEWSSRSTIEQPQAGVPWVFRRIARIPSSDYVRATTHVASETPIRMSHRLGGTIAYLDKATGKERKVSLITIDVTLSSCCALHGSLMLPSYKDSKETKVEEHRCQCKRSFKELVDMDVVPAAIVDTASPAAALEARGPGKLWLEPEAPLESSEPHLNGEANEQVYASTSA